MRTIPAGEFKAKCLKIMDEIAISGEPIIVTKRGKPVVSVGIPGQPLGHGQKTSSIFGRLRHMATIHGDIVSSEFSNEEWQRMEDEKWADLERKDTI